MTTPEHAQAGKSRWSGAQCCGKRSYATQEAAERALHHIEFVADGRHPVRAYRCPGGGWWHLTSQPYSSERKEPA